MVRLIRLILAILFLWTAYAKLVMPAGGPTMYEHWLTLWPPLRFLVPGAEAFLGFWLLIGVWARSATIVAIVLVSCFCGLLVAEMGKSHPLPCGCMGALAAAYDPKAIRTGLILDLGRNVFIIVGACWLCLAVRPKQPAASAIRSGVNVNKCDSGMKIAGVPPS